MSFVRWPWELAAVPSCWGRGSRSRDPGPEQEMALFSRAWLSLCLLSLLLPPLLREAIVAFGASVEHPNISHRPQRSVLEELSAPLELPQPLPDLLDDYGIQPKHPRPRGPRPLLSRAQQRKRDGPDMAEYYFDTRR